MEEKIKVKLLVDLTKYANGLVEGTEGYTVGNRGMWSRGNDNFVTVCFPGIATLDVLWKSLKIIDEEYLKQVEESNKKWKKELKTARNVELHLGPRSGFRYLSFEYTTDDNITSHYSIGFKNKAEETMKILKEYNIPIKEKIDN